MSTVGYKYLCVSPALPPPSLPPPLSPPSLSHPSLSVDKSNHIISTASSTDNGDVYYEDPTQYIYTSSHSTLDTDGPPLNDTEVTNHNNDNTSSSSEVSPLSTNSDITSPNTTPTDVTESTNQMVPPDGIMPLESTNDSSVAIGNNTEEWMAVNRKKKQSKV